MRSSIVSRNPNRGRVSSESSNQPSRTRGSCVLATRGRFANPHTLDVRLIAFFAQRTVFVVFIRVQAVVLAPSRR